MLTEAAEASLTEGDIEGALPALQAGLAAAPTDPRLAALVDGLEARARSAAPAESAALFAALAALFEGDEARSSALRGAALRADTVARYAAAPAARAGLDGITREAACDLLAQIDAEYHEVPNAAEMIRGGEERLTWLAGADGQPAAWPGLEQDPWADRAEGLSLCDSLSDIVALGEAAGIPAEVTIAEWVAGALAALDPWTRPVWPAEIAAWSSHYEGVVMGVGLELDVDEAGRVYVARPLPGAPAWESGIHQGDRIARMSDPTGQIALDPLPPEQRLPIAEAALLGAEGSPLTLEIERPGEGPMSFTILRGPVTTETVRGWRRGPDNAWDIWLDEADGLAYVQILTFRPPTEADFDALTELSGLRGLVLDLRGNPGGDLQAALQLADRFVADGPLVLAAGRSAPSAEPGIDPQTGEPLAPWNAAVPGHALEGAAAVVLVDGESASASEILAGALQERAGALVVGAPTWGKGYAQALRVDEAGRYGVQFTNYVWALPSGRRLARGAGGGGIAPNLRVELSPAEAYQVSVDARRRAALRVHADGAPMAPPDLHLRADLPELGVDPALQMAELGLRALLAERGAPEAGG